MKKIILLIIIILMMPGCNNNLKKDENKLFIAIDEYLPYAFHDKNKNLVGFNIDLSNLVCQKIKMKCEFHVLDFKEIFGSIDNNVNDLTLGNVKTKEREENLLFSIPYMNESIGILKYNKDNIKKISTIPGTIESFYVEKNFKKEQIVYFDNINQKFQAFKSKNIDALMEFFHVIKLYLKENPINEEVFLEKIENQNFEICFVMKKNNLFLKQKIDAAINELIKDGSIEKLKEKYGLD